MVQDDLNSILLISVAPFMVIIKKEYFIKELNYFTDCSFYVIKNVNVEYFKPYFHLIYYENKMINHFLDLDLVLIPILISHHFKNLFHLMLN